MLRHTPALNRRDASLSGSPLIQGVSRASTNRNESHSAQTTFFRAVEHALQWSSPWYWIILAVPLFTVSVLHPVPWWLRTDDPTFLDLLTFFARRISVYALEVLVFFVPLIGLCLYAISAGAPFGESASSYGAWFADRLGQY